MRTLPRRSLIALVSTAALILTACGGVQAPAPAPAVEVPPPARGPFVSAANPLAVEAGLQVLRDGGSAVDAAVAVQAVLGLVEPQSSGLGGGAFLMHFDAETGEITSFDGRETAPAAAGPELFFEDGRPLGYRDAVLSGRSTGVPGAVAMLGMAHEKHGRLAWSGLFGHAERLAREGATLFELSATAKERLYAVRQPPYVNKPRSAATYRLAATGEVSSNEA
jgi:gamma-glutamyltranspeptidase/glutathione hydrolase